MEPITWTEEFSVGVSGLDRQHKKLIGLLNRLIGAPETTTRSETIAELLAGMIAYAREHFRDEEALLLEYGYPLTADQVREHTVFIEKTVDLCTAVEVGVESVPQVMFEYLKKWLVRHILLQDMKYRRFLQERGMR